MSLLTDLFRTAVDDDYRDAALRRQQSHESGDAVGPPAPPRRVQTNVLLAIGVVVLGLLLATTAIQARRSAPDAALERQSLIQRIEVARAEATALTAQVAEAETALADAQDAALATTEEGAAVRSDLDRLELVSGAAEVTGPGLVVVLDDAVPPDGDGTDLEPGPDGGSADGRVQDVDLRQLLNALWSAGAEAVSIDGNRVTSRTSVRAAGQALFVDLVPLLPPYEIRAIGDPEQLAPRFLDSYGASWLQTLAGTYGIRFDVTTEAEVGIPPAPGVELTWAHVEDGAQ